jgi:hypothetical protein
MIILRLSLNLQMNNRWLPPGDPLREGYGDEGPPAARTHDKACAEAKDSESKPHHTWKQPGHVRLKTGINHWCPLSVLEDWDMIWDFCPDMMHIIKTFWERLVLGVFSGKRKPVFTKKAPKKPNRDATDEERRLYNLAKRTYNAGVREWKGDCEAFDACSFTMADQQIVDRRVQNLVGYPYWIRNSMVQHAHTRDRNIYIIL